MLIVPSIQYHTALVNLLEPLLYLEETRTSTRDAIADLLVKHSKEGLSLLIRYCELYSAEYMTPVMLFCTVQVCDAIVSHDCHDQSTIDTIRFCLVSLTDAKACYPIAGPLARMFANSLHDRQFDLPSDLQSFIPEKSAYELEELLNACTRPTYRIPVSQLLPSLKPSLAEDFLEEWQRANVHDVAMDISSPVSESSTKTQRSMQISSLLNETPSNRKPDRA